MLGMNIRLPATLGRRKVWQCGRENALGRARLILLNPRLSALSTRSRTTALTGDVYPAPNRAAVPTSPAPMLALPVDSRCTSGVLPLDCSGYVEDDSYGRTVCGEAPQYETNAACPRGRLRCSPGVRGGGIWQQSRIEMTLGIILLFLVLSEMDDAWHWHTSVMRWVRRLYQMGLLRWQSARATILERLDKDGRGGL